MAALVAATTERPRVAGDISLRIFSFAAVANADTFAVPGATRVLGVVNLSVSTSASVQWTISGSTITALVSAGNPAATIGVLVG